MNVDLLKVFFIFSWSPFLSHFIFFPPNQIEVYYQLPMIIVLWQCLIHKKKKLLLSIVIRLELINNRDQIHIMETFKIFYILKPSSCPCQRLRNPTIQVKPWVLLISIVFVIKTSLDSKTIFKLASFNNTLESRDYVPTHFIWI